MKDAYAGGEAVGTPYTDADVFFGEATYPTSGMRALLSTVLRRISGDATASAVTRLETGFGGGKTHSLIGLIHCAKRGSDIRELVEPLFPDLPLPAPGEVEVVAIAGDVLSVNKTSGAALVPYTLWGELAKQVGEEKLYREVESDAASIASPGKDFLERVLGGRKIIILIDELAQYVARFEAAHRSEGARQVEAFLMTLSTFVRSITGTAVVVSLASSSDAFARQSENLGRVLSEVTGAEVQPDQAVRQAVRAVRGAESVTSRVALSITPVPQSELVRVLSRRMFSKIDMSAAKIIAEEYVSLYASCTEDLPSEAVQNDYRDQIEASYPFHPTFIRFLNEKLASIETFQGTRGVLRVMALAIRLIWEKKPCAPMIHIGHLDFSSPLITDEIVGSRLKASDLQIALSTDVGGPQTEALASNRSRAQVRDAANPLPSGLPYHEMTWRTVLMNSLVGRSGGVSSNLFGINEADAIFSILMPDLPSAAVKTALKGIQKYAYYLRYNDGKFLASTDPTINRVLNDIRDGISNDEALRLIMEISRKVITKENGIFQIHEDVMSPHDINDSPKQPSLGIVRVDSSFLEISKFIETMGDDRVRISQNHVALLIPNTVKTDHDNGNILENENVSQNLDRLVDQAREVLAMEKLNSTPGAFGLALHQLDDEFQKNMSRARHDLNVAVTKSYMRLIYSGPDGTAIRNIRVTGGEGGTEVVEKIKEVLRREGKIIETDRAASIEVVHGLSKFFFGLGTDTPSIEDIRNAFAQQRRWPILEAANVLHKIIRAGVEHGAWCLFQFTDSTTDRPSKLYDAQNQIPMNIDLSTLTWSIIEISKARARGWIKGEKPSESKIREWALAATRQAPEAKVSSIIKKVKSKNQAVSDRDVLNILPGIISQERYLIHDNELGQTKKPQNIREGANASTRLPRPDDCLISRSEASKRGWLKIKYEKILVEREGDQAMLLINLLRRMAKLEGNEIKCTVSDISIQALNVPGGGSIDLKINDVSPEGIKSLEEIFEDLAAVGRFGNRTFASIEIERPEEECVLVAGIRGI